jgi:cyclophilin family peptidyl-prolyl cis-trans isomerase/protein-disulfide isomerase
MMLKKLLFVLLFGALLLSACAPQAVTPVESPEPVVNTEPEDNTDRMPCTTIYDYPTTAETDRYQAVVDQLPPLNKDDWVRGNPDAPITIFEYADFQCPACVNFAQLTNFLLENFPSSVQLVFRHLPLYTIHDKAYLSGMAAEAAGAQGKFWEMHDFLYMSQNYWYQLPEQEFIDWILDIAAEFELDVAQFETDLLDPDKRSWLEEETEAKFALGLNYTPTVVVNDRIYRDNKPNLFGLVGIYEFGGYQECPAWVIDPDGSYLARLDTSAGEIDIELFAEQAPLAVNSFIFLAQNGWYDDVYFHRVIPGFVVQAGDPSGLGMIGPGYTFVNENDNDLSFDRKGLFAMANAGVDTNGSQFFITLAPASNLDGGFTIFGQVTEASMDILDEIAIRDPQTADGFEDATIIYGVEIIEN